MQVEKAFYDDGRIESLTHIEGVKHARPYVMVLDEEDGWEQDEAELAAFQELAVRQFSGNGEEKDVDWEEACDVKAG